MALHPKPPDWPGLAHVKPVVLWPQLAHFLLNSDAENQVLITANTVHYLKTNAWTNRVS